MGIPVLTFFNNKGGVGKTTLAYHLAWMFGELGLRVLAVDLDPQANLTSAFLDEDQLVGLWEEADQKPNTIFRCIRPLLEVGDVQPADQVRISPRISLVPGDLALSGFEEELSGQWPASMRDTNLIRPFKVLSAFWQVMQAAAAANEASLILVDVGPNLGAINRSALIASDWVLIPLKPDLFSLQGLRNLGPALESWRRLWKRRLENWGDPSIALPEGVMRPAGYVAQQHDVRLDRPVRAYSRWIERIPLEYRRSVLRKPEEQAPAFGNDPECLATLRHYRSLVPMAMEARKPIFALRSADGAIGAHSHSVRSAYADYRALAEKILARIGVSPDARDDPGP
ncbi:MAG: ParA family protein [Acetobacteraceae bacterium]